MDEITTNSGVTITAKALSWKFSRSGGPGGQGVNTTDSRVELTCITSLLEAPDEVKEKLTAKLGESVVINASTTRSQLQNREDALNRLVRRIDAALKESKPRRKTRAPRWVESNRREAKTRNSEIKASRAKIRF